ncbi:fused response regulator/phosphatase [Pseudonocardia acidicola]|uniref:Fused response regulator/phosphatase n=1 Tax=Pseudonocardia acidicola TaxID=2724939 RepID=A0ABX1SD54_9PSEU|nr:fused response regulator/phosphatase [Pseudonocardia acidicola]NMH99503.1 fused response regulator/phosphatase [Pseudonocardia acidicola]
MTTVAGGPDADDPALILVVDDTPASRYISASWLRRSGHQVVEAATGAEAFAALARWPVDLVVLDVGLPDMTGFEVCERIKADPALALPVIHLSATAIRGVDRVNGLTRGADAYLVEPVEPDELLATVGSVLRYYRARAAAERLADRLTRLTRATLAMNAAASFDQLARAIAVGASDVLGVPSVAVVTASDGTLRRATVDPERRIGPVCDVAAPDFLRALSAQPTGSTGDTAVSRVPWRLLVPGTPDDGEGLAMLFGSRGGRPTAGIAVHAAELRDERSTLLAQLGQAAALAADSLRLYTEEHTLALTLQRSFLPSPPSELPGLEIAARYVPAARNAEIGGDFYEFVELGGGRLLVAIGDVAGHSIHAATVMVELRHALRAYAIEGHGPGALLDRLERTLRHFHPLEFATLCVLLLDPDRNSLTVANAGHLPPLLIDPTGAEYLQVRGPMLGLRRPQPPDTVLELPPSWSIVLITDGLVEERDVDLDGALEELRTVASADDAPEQMCERLLERFGRARLDDIALLVLRQTR